MIPYHGLPAGLNKVDTSRVFHGRHVMISLPYKSVLGDAWRWAASIALDCGAYTEWRKGRPFDPVAYVGWVTHAIEQYQGCIDWCLIPDTIDGGEEQNDRMLRDWPIALKDYGVPVWHLHESIRRLDRLCNDYPMVALGGSGDYASPGSNKWWSIMEEAWKVIPASVKVHGLRMLSPKITAAMPLYSADSTTAGRNTRHTAISDKILENCTPATRGFAYREHLEAVINPGKFKSPKPNGPLFNLDDPLCSGGVYDVDD